MIGGGLFLFLCLGVGCGARKSGDSPRLPPRAEVEVYDPVADVWTIGPSMPVGLIGSCGVEVAGEIPADHHA